jgi:DNA ligase-1
MIELTPWAELCERLASTPKKLDKRAWMADYLRGLPAEAQAQAALYLAGSAFAETDSRRLSVGGAALSRVIKELAGAGDAALHAAYLRHGDLGAAAADLLAERMPADAPLCCAEVAEAFAQLAAARGNAPKQALLTALLGRATPLEAKYLIKLMLGDMRIGVKQAQVEEAIAVATERPLPEVRRAVMLLGDLGEVVRLAASDRLAEARMRLFHPLGFMLASPVATVADAMARFAEEARAEAEGKGGAEVPPELDPTGSDAADASPLPRAQLQQPHIQDKYDGIRCQLHCGDPGQPGRVALFSRTREDMTGSFPELTEAFAAVPEPLILDGEVLAWSPAGQGSKDDVTARALPFSSLQNRIGRKRVTAAMREQTPVVFMAFDLLYRGDSLLLQQPLAARRAALEEVWAEHASRTRVGSAPGGSAGWSPSQSALFAEPASAAAEDGSGFPRLVLAPVALLESAEQLEQAYGDARARGNEGVMLKAAASLYQPGRRGLAWLKLKRELATLDVVVTAAEYGNGRRAGTLSDYTFAVRDGDTLKNVGKAYSGLTDVQIAQLSEYFHQHTIQDYGSWRTVEPAVVIEVAFNNLMRSERHASGFAMRFPRILRIRDDKPVEEIDTLERVEEIYNAQPDRPVDRAKTREMGEAVGEE